MHNAVTEPPKKKLKKENTVQDFVDDTSNYFELLPDEVLLKICQFLPNVDDVENCLPLWRNVSKKWMKISYDSSLWKIVNLDNKPVNIKNILNILSRGTINMSLHQACMSKEQSVINIKNSDSFTNKLEFLNLSQICIDDKYRCKILEILLYSCVNLKQLNMAFVCFEDFLCKYIAQNKELKFLIMCYNKDITVSGIMQILEICRELNILDLSFCNKINMDKLCTVLPSSITRLFLAGCENLKDNHIKLISSCCPNLLQFHIPLCRHVSGLTFQYIAEGCPNVKRLALSRNFIGESYFHYLKNVPKLESIILIGVIDAAFLTTLKKILPKVLIMTKFKYLFPYSYPVRY